MTRARVRIESFGAWVSLDDGTLVAIDRARAKSLGIAPQTQWDESIAQPPPVPLEAHVAVTSHCPATCSGCYQHASPAGTDVPTAELLATLDAIAAAGVFTVAFGGGEPIGRDDLGTIAVEARARGLTPVVTTSGIGLTRERARALRAFAQVNVSHDGVDGAYRAVRGFSGASVADRAIEMLVSEGIAVGVNTVLTRASFDHVEATAAHVRSLGARELQLLRYKPAGRAADASYLAMRLTRAQTEGVYGLLERLVATHGAEFGVRIDCALVPFVASQVTDARVLEQWGVFRLRSGSTPRGSEDRRGTQPVQLPPCDTRRPARAQRFHRSVDAGFRTRCLPRIRHGAPRTVCVVRCTQRVSRRLQGGERAPHGPRVRARSRVPARACPRCGVKNAARAMGVAAALALGPFVYVVVRLVELRIEPEADPTVIVFAERSALLGRCTVTAFVTALVLGGTVAFAERWRVYAAPMVTVCATVSAVAIVLQSVFAP